MAEEKPEEETYSLIYKSLKHPIRRKILRILKNKPLTFSEILDSVGIDSGHLNYHLESLSDLIFHSQDGKYQLSSVGLSAVKLLGGVEEHSLEFSKPMLKPGKVFAVLYPLILSAALIIAGLYFIGYNTSVTKGTNGVAWFGVLPIGNVTVTNSTTGINQTGLTFFGNLTVLNVTSSASGIVNGIGMNVTLTTLNATATWEELEKPYFYYGIAGLFLGLVYPAVALIETLRELRCKRVNLARPVLISS